MLPAPEKYSPRHAADVLKLVMEHPLAWLVGEGAMATPLPLRPVVDHAGALVGFLGHFARSNPQVDVLREAPRATLLFMGPHGYISPSWMADRTQAPSWNYASAAFDCDLAFIDTPDDLRTLMDDIIDAMERGRPGAWSAVEMGKRYESLSRGVVGFRAVIRQQRPVFKLAQDDRDDVLVDILRGLRAEGQNTLADWIADFGKNRL